MIDYFQLFDLRPDFAIDVPNLATRYRELMSRAHPDRFSGASPEEQRAALEQAANLNEAYQTLRSPSRRALHLLTLQGQQVPLEATVQDPEFLMQQMQWREELEELQSQADLAGIARFKKRLGQEQQALEHGFGESWRSLEQRALAERLVRRMQFLERLGQEVERLEDRLDD